MPHWVVRVVRVSGVVAGCTTAFQASHLVALCRTLAEHRYLTTWSSSLAAPSCRGATERRTRWRERERECVCVREGLYAVPNATMHISQCPTRSKRIGWTLASSCGWYEDKDHASASSPTIGYWVRKAHRILTSTASRAFGYCKLQCFSATNVLRYTVLQVIPGSCKHLADQSCWQSSEAAHGARRSYRSQRRLAT